VRAAYARRRRARLRSVVLRLGPYRYQTSYHEEVSRERLRNGVEGVAEVGEEVVDGLEADGEADERAGHFER
jgi:hypothetical protein